MLFEFMLVSFWMLIFHTTFEPCAKQPFSFLLAFIYKENLNSTHFKRKFETFLYRLSLAFSDFFILYGKYDSFLDYLL